MVSPRLLQNVMREFGCSAMEAQAWLFNPHDQPFEFSNGTTYTPETQETI